MSLPVMRAFSRTLMKKRATSFVVRTSNAEGRFVRLVVSDDEVGEPGAYKCICILYAPRRREARGERRAAEHRQHSRGKPSKESTRAAKGVPERDKPRGPLPRDGPGRIEVGPDDVPGGFDIHTMFVVRAPLPRWS